MGASTNAAANEGVGAGLAGRPRGGCGGKDEGGEDDAGVMKAGHRRMLLRVGSRIMPLAAEG